MTERALRISPRAARDLTDQAAFIAVDSPRAAERFTEMIDRVFSVLAAHPGMGIELPRPVPGFGSLRRWCPSDLPSRLVYYRVTRSGVVIVRVLHGSRDQQRALRRG